MSSTKKYEILKDKSIVYNGRRLYRIKALRAFKASNGYTVKVGDIGGFVESENNLSQKGCCWIFFTAKVYDNAKVFDNACVYGAAEVYGKAEVCGNAKVYDEARVFGKAAIYDNAKIFGCAKVYDKARVFGNAQIYENAEVFGNAEVFENAEVLDCAYIFGNAQVFENAGVYDRVSVLGRAKVYGDAAIYDEAVLRGSSQVYGRAVITDKACIFGEAKIFGESEICGDAQISGTAEICDLKINTGEYIHGSKEITTLLNEIERLKEKISLVEKVAKANFPMEKDYIESLSSKVKEYTKIYYAALDRNTTISSTLREKFLPALNEIINEDSKLAELKKAKECKA